MSEEIKKNRKAPKTKKSVDPIESELQKINSLGVSDKREFRKLMTSLFSVVSANSANKNMMSVIADSIVSSFDNHAEVLKNYVEKIPTNLRISIGQSSSGLQPSINEIKFVNPGNPETIGDSIINVSYFDKAIGRKKEELNKLDGKYKDYEFIEYKYQVSNLVTYYMGRFPEILDLFQVFADICINKADVGVSVEFSDKFIKKFFLDEFKKKLEEVKQQENIQEQQNFDELSNSDNNEGNNGSEKENYNENDISNESDISANSDNNDNENSDLGAPGSSLFDDLNPSKSSNKITLNKFTKILDQLDNSNVIKKNSDDYDVESVLVDPKRKNIDVYEEIYNTVVNEYRDLISMIERKMKDIVTSQTVKKVKYATVVADTYGYSILTIDKDTGNIHVYNPLELKIFKRKDSDFNIDEFIFAKSDGDKLVILNDKYDCRLFSLDAMILMPIPNIVRISWYLYLLDLVEVLIIFNDLLKSKTIHLLQIPVFDNAKGNIDDEGEDVNNITDSLSLMNMIINNIESKLILDSEYLQSGKSSEDVAMKLLKNVGLTIAYVPKLTENTRIDDVKLDTPNNEYDTLRSILLEKIFSVLKLPLWIRTNADIMSSFKTIPREVVQFGHLVFMSRVNGCLSELEELIQTIIVAHMNTVDIRYNNKKIKPEFEEIKITLKNMLEDFLFDRQITESVRQTKISNVLSLFSTGLEMNPKWIVEYIFPEYTVGDIILPTETDIDAKRQEISTEIEKNSSAYNESDNENMFQDLFSNENSESSSNNESEENIEPTQSSQFFVNKLRKTINTMKMRKTIGKSFRKYEKIKDDFDLGLKFNISLKA